MIMYAKFAYILILDIIISISTLIWYWVIVPYRQRAREVVYEYATNNNVYIKHMNINKKVHLPKLKYSILYELRYLYYKWVIWIWLDDNVDSDTVDNIKLWNFTMNKYDSVNYLDRVIVYIIKHNLKSVSHNDKMLNTLDYKQVYNNTLLQCAFLYISASNNFEYMYCYKPYDYKPLFKTTFFGIRIGWLPTKDKYTCVGYKASYITND